MSNEDERATRQKNLEHNRFHYATSVGELIRATCGASSLCWVHPVTGQRGTGDLVFDDAEALRISDEALQRLDQLLGREIHELMEQ